jgi:hypothetical protein
MERDPILVRRAPRSINAYRIGILLESLKEKCSKWLVQLLSRILSSEKN